MWLFPGEGYCDLQVPSTVSAVYWEIISFIPFHSMCINMYNSHTGYTVMYGISFDVSENNLCFWYSCVAKHPSLKTG